MPSAQRQSWWGIVAAAARVSAATAPGQTAGLSPFTDPLIDQLGLSRTAISTSYLVGTLAGAAALPFIGRGIDRWGPRKVITVAALTFSVSLFLLSFVTELYGLTAGFVILRMAGQGTLTLAATTAVVKAIHHRRGLAVGITAAIGSAGISLTPVIVDRLIVNGGIGFAWQVQSIAVLIIVLPLVFLLPRHTSHTESSDQTSDRHNSTPGTLTTTETSDNSAAAAEQPMNAPAPASSAASPVDPAADNTNDSSLSSSAEPAGNGGGGKLWSSKDAARTPIFWAIAAALATTGMLSTALAFHQVSILTSHGLSATEAAANFIPQTITAILATLIVGAIAHRLDPRYALAGSMVLLASALCFLPIISGFALAVVYGLILGAAGGSIRAIEPIALAHYYGTDSIGGIRGVITSINVGSTALGPVLFSIGRDLTGSYAIPSLTAAAIPLVVGIVAILCPSPTPGTD